MENKLDSKCEQYSCNPGQMSAQDDHAKKRMVLQSQQQLYTYSGFKGPKSMFKYFLRRFTKYFKLLSYKPARKLQPTISMTKKWLSVVRQYQNWTVLWCYLPMDHICTDILHVILVFTVQGERYMIIDIIFELQNILQT